MSLELNSLVAKGRHNNKLIKTQKVKFLQAISRTMMSVATLARTLHSTGARSILRNVQSRNFAHFQSKSFKVCIPSFLQTSLKYVGMNVETYFDVRYFILVAPRRTTVGVDLGLFFLHSILLHCTYGSPGPIFSRTTFSCFRKRLIE